VIVVDSSIWIGVFANSSNRPVETFLSIEDRTQILVGDIVLLEVLRGARSESVARQIEADLRRFDVVQMLDPQLAAAAASNYRRLRSVGITIRNTADLIIGTYCIKHSHQLLHRDRDFDKMQQLGLQVYAVP
jgi:predicted nucleic acid-binding protein